MTRSAPGRLGVTVAGAAVLVAAVTLVGRLAGAVRTGVLGRVLGATPLADAYTTANTIPTVLYEVLAGGALAVVVVPLVAGAVGRGDRHEAGQVASALLSWALVVLVPAALLLALAAGPVVAAFGVDPAARPVATRMLVVFSPQVVLYGVGIVLAGVLQAHRRFLGPALAPALSSLVVIASYLAFTRVGGSAADLSGLPRASELILSGGTTLGVAVLALCLLVPLRATGLPLRPTLRFPAGGAARARRLAAGGLLVLLTQQAALAVALRLANGSAPTGSALLLSLALTVFLVPWAVLAVPVATTAFPALAESAQAGNRRAFAATSSAALQTVCALGLLGAAAVLAAAGPVSRVLLAAAPALPGDATAPQRLAHALVAFAPGLVGYAALAVLTRALYAWGQPRAAATSAAAGWVCVVLVDLVLAGTLPAAARVTVLGVGNTVGLSVGAVLLVLALRRHAGPDAVRGGGRVLLAGLPAVATGATAGWLLVRAFAGRSPSAAVLPALGGALLAMAVTAAVLLLLAGSVLRPAVARLR